MPHRVTSFFRSSSNSLENQVSNFKKATTTAANRSASPGSSSRNSRSSERAFSYASSIEDDAEDAPPYPAMTTAVATRSPVAMEKHEAHHEQHHRLSFPGLHFGRSSKESHSNPNASLDMKVESPPLVLYGDAENSSGALMSGQLFLNIKEDGFQTESFGATLKIHVTQKRPYAAHCDECINQYTELSKWEFLTAPLAMMKGQHAFPFSVLLGGHLPATLDAPLVSISYVFKAEVIPKAGFGVPIKFEKIFDVKRSLPTPELPHHSVRIFPPTNIKASVHFPHVIHPIGQNTLSLRMDGIAKTNPKNNTIEYWKLKKLTWRLEENAKTVAPACAKHSPKDPDTQQPAKKGVARTDTRVIGEKTMFNGWKSSYAGPDDSSIEVELEYALSKHAQFSCDTKSRDGSEVSHQLMVEMVVSQEWAPIGKPALVTQTGIGRILRMHFATVLTERAGIGISWDNEAPPIYQDVPPSPPAYSEELGESAILEHMEPLDSMRISLESRGSRS